MHTFFAWAPSLIRLIVPHCMFPNPRCSTTRTRQLQTQVIPNRKRLLFTHHFCLHRIIAHFLPFVLTHQTQSIFQILLLLLGALFYCLHHIRKTNAKFLRWVSRVATGPPPHPLSRLPLRRGVRAAWRSGIGRLAGRGAERGAGETAERSSRKGREPEGLTAKMGNQ